MSAPTVSQFSDELNWSRLLPGLTIGTLSGILQVLLAISFAALIFRGPLEPYLSNGIGFAIMAAVIGGAAVSLLTSAAGAVSGNQDVPSAIMAISTLAIVQSFPAATPNSIIFATVVAFIGITTTLAGIVFFLVGRYRLGNMVRLLPYPVVGGFLAGTGWLLFIGGTEIMAGVTPSLSTAALLVQPAMLLRWLPGVLLAVFLSWLLQGKRSALLLPATLLGGMLLFFLISAMLGVSLPELTAQGWLLGPFPQQSLWQPLALADLQSVSWAIIVARAPDIATIILMSTIALLLNGSGLELSLGQELSLDRELRAAGIGNMLAGLFGGLVTFQQISLSALGVKFGGASRLVGLIAVLFCIAVLLGGAAVLSLFPKLVLGALVCYLGLSFLIETLVKNWAFLPRADYLVILLILAVTAFVGFMEATAVGLLVAIALFVVKYSRIDNIRNELDGYTAQSRVTRSPDKCQVLNHTGKQLMVFRLQGFLFFGTAESLLARMRQRVDQSDGATLRYLLLDFDHVTGVDSTALICLDKLLSAARRRKLTLVLTAPLPELQRYLDLMPAPEPLLRVFPDLDRGLEWCEEQRLQSAGVTAEADSPLRQILAGRLSSASLADRLLSYFERVEVAAGHTLMHRGDEPHSLYLVESGQVSAYLHEADGSSVRLQTMHDWNVLGEIGFLLGSARTASVEVEAPGVVYCLTQARLEALQQDDASLASAFHQLIAQLLAERVTHLVSVVDALRK